MVNISTKNCHKLLQFENRRKCSQRIKNEYHNTSKQYLFLFLKRLKIFESWGGGGGGGSFTAVDKFLQGLIFVNN